MTLYDYTLNIPAIHHSMALKVTLEPDFLRHKICFGRSIQSMKLGQQRYVASGLFADTKMSFEATFNQTAFIAMKLVQCRYVSSGLFADTKMSLEATFKQTAESFSKEINQTLTNDDLKEVYGLYKQVLCQA